MKTKITILSALAIALFSFTLTTKSAPHSKAVKKNPTQVRTTKGLAMEDKNQFN